MNCLLPLVAVFGALCALWGLTIIPLLLPMTIPLQWRLLRRLASDPAWSPQGRQAALRAALHLTSLHSTSLLFAVLVWWFLTPLSPLSIFTLPAPALFSVVVP